MILQTIPYTKGKVVTDLSQTDPLQDNHRSVFDTIACMLHNYALYASYRTTTCISHASHLLVLTAAIHSMDSLNLYMVMTDLSMTAIIFIYHECHLQQVDMLISKKPGSANIIYTLNIVYIKQHNLNYHR